ncbi:HVO_2922 family protein [Natronorubrum halophilum]|uniref:HVO_2922 family protein n=1 Tax=Natronorubrum halophilum TaxID=1702106 RepID=UPI0010C1CA20|nr:HVO_2922 family protein [Natronorubrum halophilum]
MAESSIEFELERAYDRDELAAVFREFAAALAADRPLRIDDGERTATVTVPPRVAAEFEVERDIDDETPVAELEIELEWDDPEGSSIQLADSELEESGVESDESVSNVDSEADGKRQRAQPDERTSRFEVYEDRADEWRWRLVHWNGNIIADSGEGYTSRSNAERAVRSVMQSAPAASIEGREN